MPRKTRRFPRISREVGMGDGKEKGDCVMQSPGNIASPPKDGGKGDPWARVGRHKKPRQNDGVF